MRVGQLLELQWRTPLELRLSLSTDEVGALLGEEVGDGRGRARRAIRNEANDEQVYL